MEAGREEVKTVSMRPRPRMSAAVAMMAAAVLSAPMGEPRPRPVTTKKRANESTPIRESSRASAPYAAKDGNSDADNRRRERAEAKRERKRRRNLGANPIVEVSRG